MPVWQVIQHPRRMGRGGRISTQLGRGRAGKNFQRQQCDWGCWTWPTDAHQASGGCLSAAPLLIHQLWNSCSLWEQTCGCQPITHDTLVTCCSCHTSPSIATKCFLPSCCWIYVASGRQDEVFTCNFVLSCNLCTLNCPPLFEPTLERSSAQPSPPASCTCTSLAQHQRQAKLHKSSLLMKLEVVYK